MYFRVASKAEKGSAISQKKDEMSYPLFSSVRQALFQLERFFFKRQMLGKDEFPDTFLLDAAVY